MRNLTRLSVALVVALAGFSLGCQSPSQKPATSSPPKEPASAKVEAPVKQDLQALMVGSWSGWPTGTEIVRRFVPHGRSGVQESLQADLRYLVVEKDAKLERYQHVGGKDVAQAFAIHEDSLLQEPSIVASEPGASVMLTIDESEVASVLRTARISGHRTTEEGVHSTFERTTNEWTLEGDATILLRRSYGIEAKVPTTDPWWAVTSLAKSRRIGEEVFYCVEVKQRASAADGYVLYTRLLSHEVPGHLVEETIEHFRANSPDSPWVVTVERTVEIRERKTPSPYSIDNKEVSQGDYQAFKASLTIEKDFVDERLPPTTEGGRGGIGAIWTGRDADGQAYEINEYTLEGEAHYTITRVAP